GELVSLLAEQGARLETYCIGDPAAVGTCAACDPVATCDDAVSPVTCACPEGYVGDGYTCAPLACEPGCDANAACVDDGAGAGVCECNAGFSGDGVTCAPNDCAPACGANATCGAALSCVCDAGFEGDAVEGCTETDECAANPCVNGGTCTDGLDSFTCA